MYEFGRPTRGPKIWPKCLQFWRPRLSAVAFAIESRFRRSMSHRRTLCQLSRFGHRRQAIYNHLCPSRFLRLPPRCRQYASAHASEQSFGQPLHETHPHLLKAGERTVPISASQISLQRLTYLLVTPGITAIEYAERRTKLAAKLPDKAIAIVAASDVKYRSGNVFYKFHQDPDFFYLTGGDLTALSSLPPT
jgi:hypothetical protein